MEALKNLGSVILGFTVVVAIICAIGFFFAFGTRIAFELAPIINTIGGILLAIDIIILLVAVIPAARSVVGLILYFSSYVFGLSTWVYGLAITLSLWGWLALLIGLFIAGIGVVPIGLLAAIFNAKWDLFWGLLIALALTFTTRLIGAALIAAAENENKKSDVIDVESESDVRTWEDIE